MRVQCYGLIVEIESADNYPDQADDLTGRAIKAFGSALELVKSHGIEVYNPEFDQNDLPD